MVETKDTREKLIKLSIRLMSEKGFNNTGISEILALAKVPKGSFYHYFKSKEELGFAIIEHYGTELATGLKTFLNEGDQPPLARLRSYFDWLINYFADDFSHCNCLLGNLGQELAMQHPELRKAIFAHYQHMEAILAETFKASQAEGSLPESADVNVLAQCLFSGWEGALVRSKLEQSLTPARQFVTLFFDHAIKA